MIHNKMDKRVKLRLEHEHFGVKYKYFVLNPVKILVGLVVIEWGLGCVKTEMVNIITYDEWELKSKFNGTIPPQRTGLYKLGQTLEILVCQTLLNFWRPNQKRFLKKLWKER